MSLIVCLANKDPSHSKTWKQRPPKITILMVNQPKESW